MKDEDSFYVQCTLKRGSAIQTSWIPEKFAKVGKNIKLKSGDSWEDGWIVANCWSKRSYDFLRKHEKDYLKIRDITDI